MEIAASFVRTVSPDNFICRQQNTKEISATPAMICPELPHETI
jgi:hypothetical protein